MKYIKLFTFSLLLGSLLSGCVITPTPYSYQRYYVRPGMTHVYYAPYTHNYYYGTPYFYSNNYYSRTMPYYYDYYRYPYPYYTTGAAISIGYYDNYYYGYRHQYYNHYRHSYHRWH